jgi:UDP-GlcNAc:undecaprenyl-phosphate/decaprenyl-phosphate GlcNAc-1-phosphate transferase
VESIQYFFTSLLLTVFITPVIIQFFHKKNLTDLPGKRKVHKVVTPSMGGVAIFFGFMLSVVVWFPAQAFISHRYLLVALGLMFLIGLRDDLIPLRPVYKIIGQILAGLVIILLSGIKLQSMYGLLTIGVLPEYISIGLTLFVIIVITNSFNLIDGLDGLAGTLSLLSLAFFGTWFYMVDAKPLAYLCIAFAGGVLGFLKFNWEPSRIFMGDTGALLLGFFFSVMAILFIDLNYQLPAEHPFRFEANVTAAISIILVPLFDTLRVFILRIGKLKSPFSPDKEHLHHGLLRLGLNHSRTTLLLGGLQVLFMGISVLLRDVRDVFLLPMVVGLCVLCSWGLHLTLKRKMGKNRN